MQNPIGVFDSGIGGTSILREIVKLLPNEDIVYLADSANAPYGEKSKAKIIALCKKNVEWLLNKKCKLIVVACNTATTNAIKELRALYKVPFVGIEPAIKPAALNSKTQKIGVLATRGTLSSELFYQTSDKLTNIAEIYEVIGTGLVEYIENGDFKSPELRKLLNSYLQPLISKNIDYLVLGCSHYPFLTQLIESILPKSIKIIDSGEAVARQTRELLKKNELFCRSFHKKTLQFYTNNNEKMLKLITEMYFNSEKIHLIDHF